MDIALAEAEVAFRTALPKAGNSAEPAYYFARFLRIYFAVNRLGPREKHFAAKVVAKAARIARHNREPWQHP